MSSLKPIFSFTAKMQKMVQGWPIDFLTHQKSSLSMDIVYQLLINFILSVDKLDIRQAGKSVGHPWTTFSVQP